MEHAFYGRQFERAARLLEISGEELFNKGEYTFLLKWIEKIRQPGIKIQKTVLIYQAMILAATGLPDEAEKALLQFEKEDTENKDDPEQEREFAGKLAAIRAMISIFCGEVADARLLAEIVSSYLPVPPDVSWRSHLLITLYHLNHIDGKLAEARQNLLDAIEAGKFSGDVYVTLDATTHLVLLLRSQGKLKEALETARQGLSYIDQFGIENTIEAGMLILGYVYILLDQHRLEDAAKYLQFGLEACKNSDLPGISAWLFFIQQCYYSALGDLNTSERFGEKVERLAARRTIPEWITTGNTACLIQTWNRMGKISEVEKYLHKRGIRPDGMMDVVHMSE